MLRLALLILFAAASLAFAADLPAGAFARLGGTALRHPERPLALAFRPGTAELISLGSDGTVKVWDTTTGKELHTLRKKDWQANGMALSADGAFLAVHFGESQLRVYDVAKKYELVGTASAVVLEGMTVTNDGKLVAGLHLGRPTLIETGNGLDRMDLPDGTAVAVASDGKSVAVAGKGDGGGYVEVFEVPSGRRMLAVARPGESKAAVTSLAFGPDGRTFAFAADGPGVVTVARLGKEEPLATFEGVGPVVFTNADTLIARYDGKVVLRGIDGKPRGELNRDSTAFTATTDGKTIATDSQGLFGSPRILIATVANGRLVDFPDDMPGRITGVAPHPTRGVAVRTTHNSFDWQPGGKPDVHSIGGPREPETANNGEFGAATRDGSLDIRACACPASPPYLERYSAKKFQEKIDLPAVALGVAVHPEGKSFAVVGRDGWVRAWSSEGKELWKARTARSLRAGIAYSPDGKTVAATSIIRVALYEATTGAEVGMIARQWEDGPFTSVAFNADGALLAAGTQGSAGAGVVYETASRGLVKRCAGANGSTVGVAFSAGATDVLVTAHADDSLLAWRVNESAGKALPPEKLWERLLDADAGVAWPAMMTLADSKSVTVIATGLKAEPKGEDVRPESEALRRKRAAVVLARIGSPAANEVLKGLN